MSLPIPAHAIRRNRAPDRPSLQVVSERHPSLDRRLHSADNIGKPAPDVANGLAFGSENFLNKCQTNAAWRQHYEQEEGDAADQGDLDRGDGPSRRGPALATRTSRAG